MSLTADLIKQRSTRRDITFRDVMQAELVIFVAAALSQNRWYPQILLYAGYGEQFPIFVRGTQHKHFERLKALFGVTAADELRARFKKGYEAVNADKWTDFWHSSISLWDAANMDKLDTIS